MSAYFEGRESDCPYIEYIWRGRYEDNYSPVCPADVRWNLLFAKFNDGRVQVSAEGATTRYVPKFQAIGAEFLVIKFKLGVFLPYMPAAELVNDDTALPPASNQCFRLHGFTWQMPDYDNVESFVERLVREDVLHVEPIVKAALQEQSQAVSSRTIRRRFLQATGLTPKLIEQIERAQEAQALLTQGVPILDAVYQLGYCDQAHMTRSLKRFIGYTPGEILVQNQSA